MVEIGELLAALHGGGRSLRTVQLTATSRADHQALMQAMERLSRQSGGSVMRMYARGPAVERPRFFEETTRLWLERPDKVREEREGEFPRFGVRVGDTWWLYSEQQGALTNNGEPNHQSGIGGEFELMLEPAPILPLFDFEVVGEELQASRPAVRVRGRQRSLGDGAGFLPSPLPHGCDDYEFVIDLETGTLLRAIGLIDGEAALDLQIVEVVFDEPIAPEMFVFTPPDDETIEDVAEHRTPLSLRIDEVAERASFAVFIATGLEEAWRMHARHVAPRRRQPFEHVHLGYHRGDGAHSFAIDQYSDAAGERFAAAEEYEALDHDGTTMHVIRPTEQRPLAIVRLQRDGTNIEITSDNLAVETLLDIATSLRPA